MTQDERLPQEDPVTPEMRPPAAPTPADALREFEELDLATVLGQFVRYPRMTLRALRYAIGEHPSASAAATRAVASVLSQPPPATPAPYERDVAIADRMRMAQLALQGLAFLVAVRGAAVMVAGHPFRAENPQLIEGTAWFAAAIVLWLSSEVIVRQQAVRDWLCGRTRVDWVIMSLWMAVSVLVLAGLAQWADVSDEILDPAADWARISGLIGGGAQVLVLAGLAAAAVAFATRGRRGPPPAASAHTQADDELAWYMRIHPARPFLLLLAVSLSVVTWLNTAGNHITDVGFLAWFGSVFLWMMGFAPRRWWNIPANALHAIARLRRFDLRRYAWVVLAIGMIMAVGAHFRLVNLNGDPALGTAIPPEMTSDHVEKILDARRVYDGSRNIFFANNGGREPAQMYLLAGFARVSGMGFTHEMLKLFKALESIVILPFMFWLGYDLMRSERPRLRILVGLALMALFTVSFWDITITRLGLRIVLTPLIAALVLLYLARAMRTNDIGDYLKVGLVLGFGLYTYQAVRMLPAVVVLGAVMALLFIWHTPRQRLMVITNLAALVIVAVAAFLPMIHYTTEYPDQFMRRAFGRLLGDDVLEERLPTGELVMREATVQERIDAFVGNLPVLFGNIRNVLLMFHWKGDVAWINNYPNYPALDIWAGALLVVGSAAWLVLAYRRRDVVYAMVPLALLVMLLPSALSIAFPIENPSFTRTSGAMPMVFLLAALPLAQMVDGLQQLRRTSVMRMAGAGVFVLVVAASYSVNYDVYMNRFPVSYIASSLPHSVGGEVVRSFVQRGGAFGNAFLIAHPNWWDHRAVGLAAGMHTRWPNGVFDLDLSDARTRDVDYVPDFIALALAYTDQFRLDPDRPLLFLYSTADAASSAQLRAWFPQGAERRIVTYHPGDDFMVYEVPALGAEGVVRFLLEAGAAPQ